MNLNTIKISKFIFNQSRNFFRKLSTTRPLNIELCDEIPSANLFEFTPKDIVNICDICDGNKVVIVGVPGAFTPVCSEKHLPGYVNLADEIKCELGISEIVFISVNDPFVMTAWGEQNGTCGRVRMLADPSACFTKALKLDIDLPNLGGIRSKRYSMIVDNNIVTELNVEPDGVGLTISRAEVLGVNEHLDD